MVRAQTYQSVMRLGVLLFYKMRIVGRNHLDAVLACQLNQHRIDLQLTLIYHRVAAGLIGLMALQLNIIILPEHALKPLHRLFRTFHIARHDLLRQFATQASRTAHQPFVVLLQ